MFVLRNAFVGLLCVCYVSCQNDDILRNSVLTNCTTADDKGGFCVKTSLCKRSNYTARHAKDDCPFLERCCEKNSIIRPKSLSPNSPRDVCGIRNPGGIMFRKKPEQNFSEFGNFPWLVAVFMLSENAWDKRYIGGGSIIHKSAVITAAHKVDSTTPEQIRCKAGEWDMQALKNEALSHQDRSVQYIVIHGEYNRALAHNDVALLILSQPFVLAPHVGIACLGRTMPQPGTECYSMGWGVDVIRDSRYTGTSGILKKSLVKLVGDNQCEINLKNTRLGSTYTLHDSLTCAGAEEGEDTCVGDGGSPLVCSIPDPSGNSARYAVYGMLAFSYSCGLKNVPGVYVNIPQLYTWVTDRMDAEGLSTSQFIY